MVCQILAWTLSPVSECLSPCQSLSILFASYTSLTISSVITTLKIPAETHTILWERGVLKVRGKVEREQMRQHGGFCPCKVVFEMTSAKVFWCLRSSCSFVFCSPSWPLDKTKRTSVRVRHFFSRLYHLRVANTVGKENEKVSERVMKIIWDKNLT